MKYGEFQFRYQIDDLVKIQEEEHFKNYLLYLGTDNLDHKVVYAKRMAENEIKIQELTQIRDLEEIPDAHDLWEEEKVSQAVEVEPEIPQPCEPQIDLLVDERTGTKTKTPRLLKALGAK